MWQRFITSVFILSTTNVKTSHLHSHLEKVCWPQKPLANLQLILSASLKYLQSIFECTFGLKLTSSVNHGPWSLISVIPLFSHTLLTSSHGSRSFLPLSSLFSHCCWSKTMMKTYFFNYAPPPQMLLLSFPALPSPPHSPHGPWLMGGMWKVLSNFLNMLSFSWWFCRCLPRRCSGVFGRVSWFLPRVL